MLVIKNTFLHFDDGTSQPAVRRRSHSLPVNIGLCVGQESKKGQKQALDLFKSDSSTCASEGETGDERNPLLRSPPSSPSSTMSTPQHQAGLPQTKKGLGASSWPHPPLDKTTVMLKCLPRHLGRDDIVHMLNCEGFFAKYDFVYLPVHFSFGHNFGYAFINLTSVDAANEFWAHFDNFAVHKYSGDDSITLVSWSNALQGLAMNVERYRNSRIMHPNMADSLKPAMFNSGNRVPFPSPTHPLGLPHTRTSKKRVTAAQ